MLTPNEVHLLVGILTRVSRPEGVEIELGSMVYDEAAEEERDVDVTVRSTNSNGVVAAFDGIEVKRHTRQALDVAQVEQLCKKLNDMPDITHRSIVSASGYSEPAIRKARRNDVDLFLLKDWSGFLEGSGVILAPGLTVTEHRFQWVGNPNVTLNSKAQLSNQTAARILPTTPITDQQGVLLANAPDFQSLANSFLSNSIALAEQQGQPIDVEVGQVKNVALEIGIGFEAFLSIDGERIPVDRAYVSGDLTRVEKVIAPNLKALVKLGDDRPHAGCAIFEMSDGTLAAFTVDQHSRSLRMMTIPVSDRLLKKIYRRRLK